MDLSLLLDITYPAELGQRGASTNMLDLQTYHRAGFITNLPGHVHLVVAAQLQQQNARGHGNRWRRRWAHRVNTEVLRLHAMRASAKQAAADLYNDQATEGRARRPFRTNPHD